MERFIVKNGDDGEIKSVFYNGKTYNLNDVVPFFYRNIDLQLGLPIDGIIKKFFRTKDSDNIYMVLFVPAFEKGCRPVYYTRTFNHPSIPLYNIVTEYSNNNYSVDLL